MNADLERTLDELGPAYRGVVARLMSARDVEPGAGRRRRGLGIAGDAVAQAPCASPALTGAGTVFRRVGWLVAASLFAAIVIALVVQGGASRGAEKGPLKVYTVAYAPTEEALEAIVASQRADGSWGNDFLTRQNAAALRRGGSAAASVAYRRAVRYLKSRGLAPLSDDELRERGDFAARTLARG